jgi:hypothetical protein
MPLLVWIACSGVVQRYFTLPRDLRRCFATAVVMIGLASSAVQAAGVRMVRAQVDMASGVESLLRAVATDVLATGQPLFHLMGFLYFDRVLTRVENADELRELVRLFEARRVRRWTYIPFYGPAFNARVVEDWTSAGKWRFRVVDDRTPLAWIMGHGNLIYLRLITYEGGAAKAGR